MELFENICKCEDFLVVKKSLNMKLVEVQIKILKALTWWGGLVSNPYHFIGSLFFRNKATRLLC